MTQEARAQAVAKRLAEIYNVEAEAILVDGRWYVVYKGEVTSVMPSMVGGIWIRRHPWPTP